LTQFTREYLDQIRIVVKQVLRETRGQRGTIGPRTSATLSMHWAIMNETVGTATNGATSPTTGEFEFLERNADGDLERTGITETSTNRWEGIEVEKDTLVLMVDHGGEYVPLGIDCSAMTSPPS